MNNSNYLQRLSASQEEKNSQEVQFKVRQAKLQLQQNILSTEEDLAQAESALESAKSSYPLNATDIVNKQVIVEAFQDGLSRLNLLELELFGTGANSVSTADEIKESSPYVEPVSGKKSKAKTPAGIARAKAAGLAVDESGTEQE